MIISVLPNLSNQGVEKLARDVFNTLNRFDMYLMSIRIFF